MYGAIKRSHQNFELYFAVTHFKLASHFKTSKQLSISLTVFVLHKVIAKQ